ncbi:acyltransferase [Methanobrevibacter sp.]|uniref:acyltransferase n=1 Tax=Methanobrevibacter sp. TaxID=66852 RepID=UPI00386EDD62
MKTDRILWVDWLKFLAIFGIVGIHVSSSLLTPDYLFSIQWYQGVVAASLFRFGIILFLMASGFLILRKRQSIQDIPRRVKRVLVPFVFWLILYAILKAVFTHELGPSWAFGDLIDFIIRGFLDPTIISVQFWYVYMILGLYILSPIISGWIQNAPIEEIKYYIWIWIIISILQFFDVHSILFDYLRYFTGAIGYFILGYYLVIQKDELFKNRTFGAILFILGSAITIIGTIGLSFVTHGQSLSFIKLGDLTPGAFLQGIGLFIIVFNTDFTKADGRINEIVVKISKMSYGIYLSNVLVINFLEKFNLMHLNGITLIEIFIYIILVIILSAAIIKIMDMLPVLHLFSGD